jgi:hypothetical protein
MEQQNISKEIDNIAKSLKLYYLMNLLNNTEEEVNKSKIQEEINIINMQKELEKQDKIQNAFKDTDKLIYNQLWRKLPIFHKLIKIKEFINLKYDGSETIENILISKLNNKELPDKHIIYDTKLGVTKDITNIKLE